MAQVNICKYSGVVVYASNILERFISVPMEVEHPLFNHPVEHIMRIAANDTLDAIERRVIVAALLTKLNLVEFTCAILPDDYTTSNLIAPLLRVVNKIAALEETELKYYPRYSINEDTRNLVCLPTYLEELEHCYLYQTQGKVIATVASQRMEATFQSKLDDAAKRFNSKTVNSVILNWGLEFIENYSFTDDVPPRVLTLIDLLKQSPQKSWKALYNSLNPKTRNLIAKHNLEELRELMYDLIPDTTNDKPKRIVLIRYMDALIEGQQRDLLNSLADLGENAMSKKTIKTVSGVSYIVREVAEETKAVRIGDKPKRADYSSAVDFAKALAAYFKG